MKTRISLLVATVGSVAFAGSLLPTMALLVNEKGNQKKVDPSKNGYIGLTYVASQEGVARMDLKDVVSGYKARILFNPAMENTMSFSIGPIVIAKKTTSTDTISRKVLVQQLPPGKYITDYFYLSEKNSGISLRPDTLVVEQGRILDLGAIREAITFNSILPTIKSFQVKTEAPIPDSLYVPFGVLGLSTNGVVHQSIDFARD